MRYFGGQRRLAGSGDPVRVILSVNPEPPRDVTSLRLRFTGCHDWQATGLFPCGDSESPIANLAVEIPLKHPSAAVLPPRILAPIRKQMHKPATPTGLFPLRKHKLVSGAKGGRGYLGWTFNRGLADLRLFVRGEDVARISESGLRGISWKTLNIQKLRSREHPLRHTPLCLAVLWCPLQTLDSSNVFAAPKRYQSPCHTERTADRCARRGP